jgi:hypothetical protein
MGRTVSYLVMKNLAALHSQVLAGLIDAAEKHGIQMLAELAERGDWEGYDQPVSYREENGQDGGTQDDH